MNRRSFLTGLICAPAIVRIDNIMPVKVFKQITLDDWARIMSRVDPRIVTPHNYLMDDLVHKLSEIPTSAIIRTRLPYSTWRKR